MKTGASRFAFQPWDEFGPAGFALCRKMELRPKEPANGNSVIILDDLLLSAPELQSAISKEGRAITG